MRSFYRARKRGAGGRIGLAIAIGGPIIGMYELGALQAMDEALDLTDLDCNDPDRCLLDGLPPPRLTDAIVRLHRALDAEDRVVGR